MLYLFSIYIRINWYTQTHSNNWAMNFMFQNLFIFKIDKWYTWWWYIKVKDRIPQSAKSNVRFTSVDGSMTSDKFRGCKSSMYVPQDRYTDLIWLQTGSWNFIFESFCFCFFFYKLIIQTKLGNEVETILEIYFRIFYLMKKIIFQSKQSSKV